MGIKSKLFGLTVIGIAIYVGLWCKNCKQPEIPKSYWEDHYWGPKVVKDGKLPVDDKAIRKFAINVPEEVLDDLKGRLNSTRIIESIQGSNFEYGFHSDQLKKVIEYWSTKYDWRKQEAILNKLTHFKTQVEGIDVHYIHAKPTGGATKVYPLLMVHGWPGSVVEFLKIIPMLTTPVDGVAFEIIAPSIPGYGWSEAPSKGGFNHLHAARVFTKLMGRLGFDKFYYQGGDWGAVIGAGLVRLYPEKTLGFHTPLAALKPGLKAVLQIMVGNYFPALVYDVDPEAEAKMLSPIMDVIYFMVKESGYMHIQATKPDTVGTALNDSPAGLAAYILEKFSTWVNPAYRDLADGGLTKKFTMDELLTNVMVYWVTETISSSQRFYKENFSYHLEVEVQPNLVKVPNVPVGVAVFPEELLRFPKAPLTDIYGNITQYTIMPRGGHFSAFEEPQLFAQDFRSFVKTTL